MALLDIALQLPIETAHGFYEHLVEVGLYDYERKLRLVHFFVQQPLLLVDELL